MWDLYIFTGYSLPKAGTRKTRFGVYLWIILNYLRMAELRAVNRETGEHIVR